MTEHQEAQKKAIENVAIDDLRLIAFKAAQLIEKCWMDMPEYSDIWSWLGQCDIPLD